MTTGDSVRAFHASALAEAVQTFNEIVVVAPPGTGKSTTLLQVVDAILTQGESVAAFVPLGGSSQSDSVLQSVVRRHAFVEQREEHLKLLALSGRLVLLMDGWNDLDAASRKRATGEIRSLQGESPSLGIVVSTRRQALDVPISGPLVEIDTLAEGQQLEIARGPRGSQAEGILDHAWRTPGVRELVNARVWRNSRSCGSSISPDRWCGKPCSSYFEIGWIGVLLKNVLVGVDEKSSGASGRVTNPFRCLRIDHLHHHANDVARCSELSIASAGVAQFAEHVFIDVPCTS
jgi:hypothetical protein